MEGSRRGGFRTVDWEKVHPVIAQGHLDGLSDRALAAHAGISETAAKAWRGRNGLPLNRPKAPAAPDAPFPWTPRLLGIAPAVAAKYGSGQAEIDELQSAAYLAMVKASRTWKADGGASAATWLYNAAELTVRRERARYRKRLAEAASLDAALSSESEGGLILLIADRKAPDPARQALAAELAADLLGRLRTLDREIVERHLFGREDRAAIGRTLGMTREAVRVRYENALRTMRKRAEHSRSKALLRDWLRNPLRRWVEADPARAAGQRDATIHRAQRRSIQIIHRRRAGTGHAELPLGDGKVAAWLSEHGEGTVAALVEALGMRPAYVYCILSRLYKAGLVEKRRGPSPRGNLGGESRYRLADNADGRVRA